MAETLIRKGMGIKYQRAGQFEGTRFEKIHNVVFENSKEGSSIVAQEIASLVKERQSKNENCVLGLATGSSPQEHNNTTFVLDTEAASELTRNKTPSDLCGRRFSRPAWYPQSMFRCFSRGVRTTKRAALYERLLGMVV